jgi:multidrug transporter EmrE-like cation transporter
MGCHVSPGFRLGDIAILTRNVPVMSGFCCYGLSTVLYLSVLARLELSLAYPTVSLGYVLVIIMSRVLFKEPVSPTRWLAAGIVALVLSLGRARCSLTWRTIETQDPLVII